MAIWTTGLVSSALGGRVLGTALAYRMLTICTMAQLLRFVKLKNGLGITVSNNLTIFKLSEETYADCGSFEFPTGGFDLFTEINLVEDLCGGVEAITVRMRVGDAGLPESGGRNSPIPR